ncbi:MAG: signal recognition particle receptor subunit alpha, partial [Candidatus Methanoplasma sp.]|nr:signal recognition particle receptor subunit alpha [Candidatus Methanoplasma sp.]
MVLEGLGKSLRDVIAHIGGSSVVDEDLVTEITKELQRALLQADG